MYPIRDYFLIGDLHTAALVSRKGSIDWFCLPHFDSSSMFGRMLDEDGGTFALMEEGADMESRYISDTATVEHYVRYNSAEYTLHDFMVPQPVNICKSHFLIRKITGITGKTDVSFLFDPHPDYGRKEAIIEEKEGMLICALEGSFLILHLPIHAEVIKKARGYEIICHVSKGDERALVLEYGSHPDAAYAGQDFEKVTNQFWKTWVEQGVFFTFCRDQLVRSAITLKLMQFYPTGAIVAAPTTSLPEHMGGERNWDYRYVWIRDATFALYALYVLGYTEEAVKFFEFIEGVARECEDCDITIHLMYTIHGRPVPEEEILSHWSGYQDAYPVRIGNGAKDQFQLDIYGSLIDAHYFMAGRGVKLTEMSRDIILHMVEQIQKHWQLPDNGIWEVRSGPKHFSYSKAMAWVGIDRALLLADVLGVSDEKKKEWDHLQKDIRQWVWDNCYDTERNILFQHSKTDKQDATNFLLIPLKFLNKHDISTKNIMQNTARELVMNDIFVDRYHTYDALKGDEGAFVLSSFWYFSALAILGETEKAHRLFEKFSTYINWNGLLSEEIDERTGEYLGNYPQAFSHMGYIMTAYYLQKYAHNARVKPEK
ncbi:MAG: hypothetical protein COU90_02620 [Candidatus Ryanbacteria bacterium CG10_big_fil_rev_8_21_14_0_10_43_42]|uniref:Glycoside hydrolase family 15 protein n=1 Tax=Candidatus Ryanbacteria bacterium CG10_big_fil_rev_8_21_14_0_10_43_42 TaxID=1974864 RepID=A0A2M8KWQ1_9BACT|nr:MAG: hypothetical protein COU90_02620 [Candidatus Ryanbacteria bacterium CG10_big_fil_rev_8_21_14_0_10_43_42]